MDLKDRNCVSSLWRTILVTSEKFSLCWSELTVDSLFYSSTLLKSLGRLSFNCLLQQYISQCFSKILSRKDNLSMKISKADFFSLYLRDCEILQRRISKTVRVVTLAYELYSYNLILKRGYNFFLYLSFLIYWRRRSIHSSDMLWVYGTLCHSFTLKSHLFVPQLETRKQEECWLQISSKTLNCRKASPFFHVSLEWTTWNYFSKVGKNTLLFEIQILHSFYVIPRAKSVAMQKENLFRINLLRKY